MNYPILTSKDNRQFSCYPAAVVIFIVNDQEEILLLHSPKRNRWEVVSGALEAAETVLSGVLREVREEIGDQVKVRPLGALHAATFAYDEHLPFMISICYLMAYEGGAIVPGDDMHGAAYQWVKPAKIETLSITPPANQRWLADRAVELYRVYTQQSTSLWHETEVVP